MARPAQVAKLTARNDRAGSSAFRHRTALLSLPGLAVATIVGLAPFVGKAFYIDDPLFLWTARQILAHPLDPYGFKVNWYGTEQRMSEIMWNPPLTAYYIALIRRT